MAHPATAPITHPLQSGLVESTVKNEASSSGISWAAVLGGAVVCAAMSLILLALGTGIGLSSVSPWSNTGASASTIGMAAIVWLIVSQIIASAMGGYLAGRLRTKWVSIHTDEVYFRDTAHGFLVWAVGLVITAAFLASAATSIIGGTAQMGASALSSADPNEYYIDTLFRSDRPTPDSNDASIRAESRGIFANGLRQKDLTAPDKTYLGQLVAARTGLTQAEAEQRVSEVFTQARQATDNARKALAHSMYWMFLALLIGAFCASFAATIGGKQRDRVVVI
ncbi:MAG: hypothetical protein ACHP8A_08210 [Terriglobales bacterium]